MASKFHIKDGGTWKEPNVWTKVDGTWTRIKYGFVKNSGVWSRFYPESGGIEYTGSYGAYGSPTSTFIFTVPVGVRSILVSRIVAGGGGGGAGGARAGVCYTYPYHGNGGGGGGYLTNQVLTVVPGSNLTINVGWGGYPDNGAGLDQGGLPATAGGDTTITGAESGTLSVTGGQPGVSWVSYGFPSFQRGSSAGGSPNGGAGLGPSTSNYGGNGGNSFSPGLAGNHFSTTGYQPVPAGSYGSGGGGGGGCSTGIVNSHGNFGAPGIVTLVW